MRSHDTDARPAGSGPKESEHELPAFESLFERYLGEVFRYVRYRVPHYEDAEDITMETFEAALASLWKCRDKGNPRAWLLGIARRKTALAARRVQQGRWRECLDGELSKKDRQMLDQLLAADARHLPEDQVLQDEARRMMRRLLAGLPAPQREALLLRYGHDLSAEEIGRVMRRSTAAVNSLLQRARGAIFRAGKEYFRYGDYPHRPS